MYQTTTDPASHVDTKTTPETTVSKTVPSPVIIEYANKAPLTIQINQRRSISQSFRVCSKQPYYQDTEVGPA
jgi:hypothetical protein